jgi:hypothetical protein
MQENGTPAKVFLFFFIFISEKEGVKDRLNPAFHAYVLF